MHTLIWSENGVGSHLPLCTKKIQVWMTSQNRDGQAVPSIDSLVGLITGFAIFVELPSTSDKFLLKLFDWPIDHVYLKPKASINWIWCAEIISLKEFFNRSSSENWTIKLFQLTPDVKYRDIMRHVKENDCQNIILSAKTDNIEHILRQVLASVPLIHYKC